jgi:hypothetical protein
MSGEHNSCGNELVDLPVRLRQHGHGEYIPA